MMQSRVLQLKVDAATTPWPGPFGRPSPKQQPQQHSRQPAAAPAPPARPATAPPPQTSHTAPVIVTSPSYSSASQRQPPSGSSRPSHKQDGMPLSLFQYHSHNQQTLPVAGQFIKPEDEYCDTMTRHCQTLTYVYEDRCHSCSGSGTVRGAARRGGRRGSLGQCSCCHGLGLVRRVTSRYHPSERGVESSNTLGRPTPQERPKAKSLLEPL